MASLIAYKTFGKLNNGLFKVLTRMNILSENSKTLTQFLLPKKVYVHK